MPGRRDARPSLADRRAALLAATADRPDYARQRRTVEVALAGMWVAARRRVAGSSALVGAAVDPIVASDAAAQQDAAYAAGRIESAQAAAVIAEAHRVSVAAGVAWSVVNPLALGVVANLGTRIAYVTGDERQRIMNVLAAAYADGLSVRDAAAMLRAAERLAPARAALIARTEMNAASNLASLAVVRAANYEAVRAGEAPLFASKRWLATGDGRTRASHSAADGQTVRLSAPFLVGGARLDSPHDPFGPAAEVVNCRCTITWIE